MTIQDKKGSPVTGLALMRVPFPPHQISKLPKPTKAQTDAVRADFRAGIRCKVCGLWHHKDVVHLDYVGHAALTDRLLDCDPHWSWEPMAYNQDGTPKFDAHGGLWIKLTVCGVTRLGYGHADGKSGGDAIKEVIGDALRNAAMRFGAALDLWHKGDLHVDADDAAAAAASPDTEAPRKPAPVAAFSREDALASIRAAQTVDALMAIWRKLPDGERATLLPDLTARKVAIRAAEKAALAAPFPPLEDEIPWEGPR